MPTDFGFRLQVGVTVLVALAVLWVGIQTGDWTGLVLLAAACRADPGGRQAARGAADAAAEGQGRVRQG